MVTLGRLENCRTWHVFVGGFQESLCGRVVRWDCEWEARLETPEDVAEVRGRICARCLKRLVAIGEIAEALNSRVP